MTTSNMGKSNAVTVEDYLNELPEERRETIAAVRQIILDNLPDGYREMVSWGMIGYGIPLDRYPNTYNKQPLSYIALASHKSYISLYLMSVYGDPQQEAWLKAAFAEAGKKLDMGKSCLHFRKLDDLPLDVIAEVVASTPPNEYIVRYEASRKR